MQVIDLSGPQGNAFVLIDILKRYDSSITPNLFGSYNELIARFKEIAGKDFLLLNEP